MLYSSRTTYGYRIVVDGYFFDKIIKGNGDITHKLMYVNAYSQDHKKNHVMMSNKSREKILQENVGWEIIIKCAIRKLNEPASIEAEENVITRNVRHAINLLSEKPHRIVIFTTNEKVQEYLENEHYKGTQNVLVKNEEEAIAIINYYFTEGRLNKPTC